jgi:tRNA-dihydrouridine synthase A
MSSHLLGLFQVKPGAKACRRFISENAYQEGAWIEVLEQAMGCVDD